MLTDNLDVVSPQQEVIWRPWPKQKLWLLCDVYEIMAGGAAGPGKTDAAIMFPIVKQLARAHKAWQKTGIQSRGRWIVLRKSFNRLKDIIARCQFLFPMIDPGVRWSGQDHMFTFSCGYRYEVGHLENPDSHLNYHGQEFSGFSLDQGEEIPWEQFVFMKSRVRTSDSVLKGTEQIFITSNPGGIHGRWVKDRFVAPHRPGLKVLAETVKLRSGKKETVERIFIPGTLDDNPSLPPSYEIHLSSLPPHLVRMLRDGDWDVTVGAYFADVWDTSLHVLPEYEPASHQPIVMGGDWGTRAPAAVVFAAITDHGDIVCLDEVYGPGSTGTEFGKLILQTMERHRWDPRNVIGWMDPGAWDNHGTDAPSPGNAMWNQGIMWEKADRSPGTRVPGWTEIRERLRAWKEWKEGKVSAKDRKPGLVVTQGCTNILRTLPTLLADEKKPDDVDTKQEDHIADALRYLLFANPQGSTPERREDEDVARWMRLVEERRQPATDSLSWS